jgi:hypothetical protein
MVLDPELLLDPALHEPLRGTTNRIYQAEKKQGVLTTSCQT